MRGMMVRINACIPHILAVTIMRFPVPDKEVGGVDRMIRHVGGSSRRSPRRSVKHFTIILFHLSASSSVPARGRFDARNIHGGRADPSVIYNLVFARSRSQKIVDGTFSNKVLAGFTGTL